VVFMENWPTGSIRVTARVRRPRRRMTL
jgi:hypothetical protein